MIERKDAADTLTLNVDRLSFDGSLERSVDMLNTVTIVCSILAGDGCAIVDDDQTITEAFWRQRSM